MIARYASTCRACKQPIAEGSEIEKRNGLGFCHTQCPTVQLTLDEPETRTVELTPEDQRRLHGWLNVLVGECDGEVEDFDLLDRVTGKINPRPGYLDPPAYDLIHAKTDVSVHRVTRREDRSA